MFLDMIHVAYPFSRAAGPIVWSQVACFPPFWLFQVAKSSYIGRWMEGSWRPKRSRVFARFCARCCSCFSWLLVNYSMCENLASRLWWVASTSKGVLFRIFRCIHKIILFTMEARLKVWVGTMRDSKHTPFYKNVLEISGRCRFLSRGLMMGTILRWMNGITVSRS